MNTYKKLFEENKSTKIGMKAISETLSVIKYILDNIDLDDKTKKILINMQKEQKSYMSDLKKIK